MHDVGRSLLVSEIPLITLVVEVVHHMNHLHGVENTIYLLFRLGAGGGGVEGVPQGIRYPYRQTLEHVNMCSLPCHRGHVSSLSASTHHPTVRVLADRIICSCIHHIIKFRSQT